MARGSCGGGGPRVAYTSRRPAKSDWKSASFCLFADDSSTDGNCSLTAKSEGFQLRPASLESSERPSRDRSRSISRFAAASSAWSGSVSLSPALCTTRASLVSARL